MQFPCKGGSRRDTQREYSLWRQAGGERYISGAKQRDKKGGESGVEGHVTGPYTSRSLRPHAGYRTVGGAVALVLEFNVTLCNIARRWSTFFLPLWLGSQTMKVQRRDATVGVHKDSEFRILGSPLFRPKHEL